MSWQASGAIAPVCAVCLEALRRCETPGVAPVRALPECDVLGHRYWRGRGLMSPVELAQRRMAEIEAHLPRVEPSGGTVDAAAVAREAFAETGPTLQGLAHVWEGQRAARMKLGRHLLRSSGSTPRMRPRNSLAS